METSSIEIHRHKTAIRRVGLSLPVKCSLRDGLLNEQRTFFDYGCGRGQDLLLLNDMNIPAFGWDPVYNPDAHRPHSDIVNIGYVINVIENQQERSAALKNAWALCNNVLIVSAQLDNDSRSGDYRDFADGILTSRNTFQKYYTQSELRAYIDSILGVLSVPAAPGVFYVFKDDLEKQAYLAQRYRRVTKVIYRKTSEVLFENNKDILEPFIEYIAQLGRLPEEDEYDSSQVVIDRLGSLKRAFNIVKKVTEDAPWETIAKQRREDLLVYLALSLFDKRPKLSELPLSLQRDVKAFLGTYSRGCKEADALLFQTGNAQLIDEACQKSPVGQLVDNALLIHRSALDRLDPLLRLYEGCARTLIGEIDEADVIKLHRYSGKVSYLIHKDFDTEEHPQLLYRYKVGLRTLSINTYDHSSPSNYSVLDSKDGLSILYDD